MGDTRLFRIVIAGVALTALFRLYIRRIVRLETAGEIQNLRGYVRAQLSLVIPSHREGNHADKADARR